MQKIRLTSDNPVLMCFHITCVYFCRHADREGRRVDLQNTTSSHSRSAKVRYYIKCLSSTFMFTVYFHGRHTEIYNLKKFHVQFKC